MICIQSIGSVLTNGAAKDIKMGLIFFFFASKQGQSCNLEENATAIPVANNRFISFDQNTKNTTVVPGFRVLGFSAFPGFRALKAGDGAW